MLPLYLIFLVLVAVGAIDVDPSQDAVTDYAPFTNSECPDVTTTQFIREFTPQTQALNSREQQYIETRLNTTIRQAWSDWLGDASNIGYNLSAFNNRFPKIGIALPGGGLRAAQYGAGCIAAVDARDKNSKDAGTGGLLQVASYITGLSGGSWVLGSLTFNNFPTIGDLVLGNKDKGLSGWLLDFPLATPDGNNLFSDDNQYFFGSILWSVRAKAQAGIDTSLTDPWARMISYHFLNQTTRDNLFLNETAHGAGQLWSNIPLIPAFRDHQMPLPIAVADSRPVGSNLTTVLSLDPVVYEITPFELASYDPNLSAAVNLTYAGTHLDNGKPDNGSACVTGFDQAGFVMGSSASLFNQLLDFANNQIEGFTKDDGGGLLYVLQRQLSQVRTRADDVANWPNPFKGIKSATFEDSDKRWIELIDGASNLENTPYAPLFVNARGLDVIINFDGSADDLNAWPNGTSSIVTQERLKTRLQSSHQQFPPIPSNAEQFVATGVNRRPAFFGCDPPTESQPEYPLVIIFPNAPPLDGGDPVTNSGTFTLTYTLKHTQLFLEQVHKNIISGFTPDSQDPDSKFGLCLQCAAIDRARLKVTPIIPRSQQCKECFQKYCYDPANPPSSSQIPGRKYEFVDPDPQGISQVTGFFADNKFKLIGGLVGLIVFIALAIAGLIWWRKRRTAKQYRAVSTLHDDDTPLYPKSFSNYVRPQSTYELPNYRGPSASG